MLNAETQPSIVSAGICIMSSDSQQMTTLSLINSSLEIRKAAGGGGVFSVASAHFSAAPVMN